MTQAADPVHRSSWRVWVSAARLRTLPAAVAPVVVGSAVAGHEHRFDPVASAICLVFALLVQVGANFANDYYDFVHGADTEHRVGPRRAVASGLVTPGAMRRAMAAVFAAAFLLGLSLIAWGGPWMLVVGVACIAQRNRLHGRALAPRIPRTWGSLRLRLLRPRRRIHDLFRAGGPGLTPRPARRGGDGGPCGQHSAREQLPRRRHRRRGAQEDLVVRFGPRFARIQFAASIVFALAVPVAFWATGFGRGCLLPLSGRAPRLLAFPSPEVRPGRPQNSWRC